MEDSPQFLLPSEIARLVYGQLESMNCHSVAAKFLLASPHLEESRGLIKEDRTFWTKAHGLALNEILEQYLNADDLVLKTVNNLSEVDTKFSDPAAALRFILTLDGLNSVDENADSSLDDTKLTANNHDNKAIDIIDSEIRPDNNGSARKNKRLTLDACDTDSVCYENSRTDPTSRRNTRKPARFNNFILPRRYDVPEPPGNLTNSRRKKRVNISKPKEKAAEVIVENSTVSPTESRVRPQINRNRTNAVNHLEETTNQNTDLRKSNHPLAVINIEPTPVVNRRTSMRLLRSGSKLGAEPTSNEPVTFFSDEGTPRSRRKIKNPVGSNDATSGKEPKPNSPVGGNENVDVAQIQQMLLDDSKMHQLIAENINKKFQETPEKKISASTKDKDVIRSIAEQTVSEDLCDEFIQSLLSCTRHMTQEEEEIAITNENIFDHPLISEEIDQHADHTAKRLQDDMNEFVNFNCQKSNVEEIPQSDVIIIEMQQDKQNTSTPNDYVVDSNGLSSYVVCAPDLASNQNGCEEFKDQIITIGAHLEPHNELRWNVCSSAMLTPMAPFVASETVRKNRNSDKQICTYPLPSSEKTKRNEYYRPIAPKPLTSLRVYGDIPAIRVNRRTAAKH